MVAMETRPLALPLEIPLEGPHHLDSLAAEIHRTYFFKVPPLRVRWGHSIARKRRRSIRLGNFGTALGDQRRRFRERFKRDE